MLGFAKIHIIHIHLQTSNFSAFPERPYGLRVRSACRCYQTLILGEVQRNKAFCILRVFRRPLQAGKSTFFAFSIVSHSCVVYLSLICSF